MSLHFVPREMPLAFSAIPLDAPRWRANNSRPFPAPLADLRPTQMAVGLRAVAAKRDKLERRTRSRRKLRRYLERRPIPAVVGPGEQLFIIDRHHLSLALWQSDVEEAFVSTLADLSHLPRSSFLRRMLAMGMLHAYDTQGQPICPTQLPERLAGLRGDPYRDLAWSVREAGGFAKTSQPYQEFHWANFFRARIPMSSVRRDFEFAHDRAMWLARSAAAIGMPGYLGK